MALKNELIEVRPTSATKTSYPLPRLAHFLLLCPSFAVERRNILATVFKLMQPFGYTDLSNEVLTQLSQDGDKDLPNDLNRNILKLTIQYMHETGRLN